MSPRKNRQAPGREQDYSQFLVGDCRSPTHATDSGDRSGVSAGAAAASRRGGSGSFFGGRSDRLAEKRAGRHARAAHGQENRAEVRARSLPARRGGGAHRRHDLRWFVADPPERDGRAAGGGIKRDSTAGFSVPGVLSKSSRKQWSGNGEHQGRRNQQDSARAD